MDWIVGEYPRARHGMYGMARGTSESDPPLLSSSSVVFASLRPGEARRAMPSHFLWWEISQKVGFQDITPQAGMSLSDWCLHLRLQLRKNKRKGFDVLSLWLDRLAAVEGAQCTNLPWRCPAAVHGPSAHPNRGGELDCGWSQEPRSSLLRGVALGLSLLCCFALCNIALRIGLASWHADGHGLPCVVVFLKTFYFLIQ